MFPFPAELLIEIFTQLTRKDLYNIALCSKSYRRQLLPFLFDRLSLSLDSLVSFQEGGHFHYLCQYVRQISIAQRYTSNSEAINQARICSSCLDLFSNATSVLIGPQISADLQYNLFAATLKQISEQRVYDSIKILSLSYPSDALPNFTRNPFLNMTETNRQFMGDIPRTSSQLPETFDMTLPSSLEELVVTVGQFSFRKPSKRQHPSFPNLFLLNRHLADKLKRLEIRAKTIEFPSVNSHPVVFHNVKILRLEFERPPQGKLMDNLVSRFQNLEDLTIETPDLPVCPPTSIAYLNLVRLPRLKQAKIPWPRAPWPHGCFNRVQLTNVIGEWILRGIDALERVEFLQTPMARFRKTMSFTVVREPEGWRLLGEIQTGGQKTRFIEPENGELISWPSQQTSGEVREVREVVDLTWGLINPGYPNFWGHNSAAYHEGYEPFDG
ncbi:hypothetical protein TWF694_002000 [Orbilia ellipsospora]|uniref:F-box domain-containing protein n=1 Tax=Orbilia ellipsospora TaxID=2528407 RepID=A0AAV9X4A8_9PEZI